MNADWPAWALTWLLRISGAVQVLALPCVLLPTAWMASVHAALGLGEFPDSPLTQYLTRSIAALYALHGGTLLVASSDVRRLAPIVGYAGAAQLTFGLIVLAIDLAVGMPWSWTLLEGPPVVLIGVAILTLWRRVTV